MVDEQPTLTLTPNPTTNDNTEKPSETLPSDHPPSGDSERSQGNPSGDKTLETIEEANKRALEEATDEARAPLRYNPLEPFVFDETCFNHRITEGDFNSAVNIVVSSMDKGYFSTAISLPLSPSEWARVSCKLLAAIGRGYRRTCDLERESMTGKIRAEVVDPNPIGPRYPTLFHRIAATASDIETNVAPDQDGYRDWYLTLKKNFNEKAAKNAAGEVEEKWRRWKAEEIEKRAASQENEISAAVRNRNARYLFTAAEELGLTFASQNPPTDPFSTPTTGKKRTVSGSTPARGPSTPTPLRISLPRAAKRTPSPADTPRGRVLAPMTLVSARTEPSPTPQSRKTPPNSQTQPNLGRKTNTVVEPERHPAPQQAQQREDTSVASMLQLILTRLEALEQGTNRRAREPSPGRTASAEGPSVVHKDATTNNDFVLVERNKQQKKGKGKAGKTLSNMPPPTQPMQINLTPASYAQVASTAADAKQSPAPPKVTGKLPGITEVTVLRSGGHMDPQVERCVTTRAADAIVREVRLNMAKAVAIPIPLKSGRWSINPHSKGNFVYSFDGCIPFDNITPYEHILLGPFQGSGQLRPSLGWTRLLAHGVPTRDTDDCFFGQDELLKEVRTMPGLKKVHLAMEPRWLRPIGSINSAYSTITFAISDPDGTTTNMLTQERTALFGKEVTIRRWIDKPALVQCTRCHALGHIRSSRACTLARNSVKCFRCGGTHKSEDHNSECRRKHAVAGVCDCKNYRCLNCQQLGHHCREPVCPARECYRPRNPRKNGRGKNKGKEKETDLDRSKEAEAAHLWERYKVRSLPLRAEDNPDDEGDWDTNYTDEDPWGLFTEAERTAQKASGSGLQPGPASANEMEVDSPAADPQMTDQTAVSSHEHSPSRPQTGAANRTMT